MRFLTERNSVICGFFSVLLFIGYFASITFGESAWLNIILIAGIVGLISGALITREAGTGFLRSWRTNSFHFSLLMWSFYFLAQYISVFFHEYSHSTTAYILGVINYNPLYINYGHGWTLSGLSEFDDKTVYTAAIEQGHGLYVALIAVAGPMMNIVLAVISLALLTRERVRSSLLLFSFFFWLALHNVSQVWSYIPQRSVWYDGGDFYWVATGSGLNPCIATVAGLIFIIAGFILVYVYLFPALLAGLRPAILGLFGLFALGWFTTFIHYGLTPLAYTLDSFNSPRVWFGALDIVLGIVFAGLFIRELKRKYAKDPWLKLWENDYK
jgi:hypothetical protein